jgi:hypothetical protein
MKINAATPTKKKTKAMEQGQRHLDQNFPSHPPSGSGKPPGGYKFFKRASGDHYFPDCTFTGTCTFCIKPENGGQSCPHAKEACMKKNPGLRGKKDQQAYGKMAQITREHSDGDESEEEEAVKIFNSVLSQRQMSVGREKQEITEPQRAVLGRSIVGDLETDEFELLTAEEASALEFELLTAVETASILPEPQAPNMGISTFGD